MCPVSRLVNAAVWSVTRTLPRIMAQLLPVLLGVYNGSASRTEEPGGGAMWEYWETALLLAMLVLWIMKEILETRKARAEEKAMLMELDALIERLKQDR
jgi:hypothetical protein